MKFNPFFSFTIIIGIFSLFCQSFFYIHASSSYDQTTWINWEENKIINLISNLLSTSNNPCNKDILLSIINKLTDNTGTLYIPLHADTTHIPLMKDFNITGITLENLNTLDEAILLEPYDKYSLFNHLLFKELDIVLHGHATKKTSIFVTTYETFTYTLRMVDAYVNATLLLGVDSVILGDLYLDQLTLGCIGSSIEDMNVTSKDYGSKGGYACQCEETVISGKQSNAFLCTSTISNRLCPGFSSNQEINKKSDSDMTENLMKSFSNIILDSNEGNEIMNDIMNEIMNDMSSQIVDNIGVLFLEYLSESDIYDMFEIYGATIPPIPTLNSFLGRMNCSAHIPNSHGSAPESYVDFNSNNSMFSKIASGLALLDVDSIDASIACATEQQSGTAGMISIAGDLFDIHVRNTDMSISDLVITGLDSFSQLLLLQPTGTDYELKSKLGIEHIVLSMGLDVSSSSSNTFNVHNGLELAGSYEMVLNMSEIHLAMSSLVELDLSKLDDLTFSQVKSKGCVMSSFDELELNQFTLHMAKAYLSLESTSTSTSSLYHTLLSTSSQTNPKHNVNTFVEYLLSLYVNVLSSSYNDSPMLITHEEEDILLGGDHKLNIDPLSSFALNTLSFPGGGSGLHMDLAPELNKLLNNSGNLIDRFLLTDLVNNANATCHNETVEKDTRSNDDDQEMPYFSDDQESVNVSEWETSMGFISFTVMAFVIFGSGLFSWMARNRRRKSAESRGYGHLGHEFVVVRADELLGNNIDVNDDQETGIVPGDKSSSGLPQMASIGKPVTLNSKSTNERLSDPNYHITPGKHLDEHGEEIDENDIIDSLFYSDRISKGYRYGLPGCCCLVILCFISANVFNGAAVYAMIEAGPLEPVVTFDFFTFTLKSSVHDFWEAKVYMLSVLIAALSGAWPYGKLLLIAGCFIAPMRRGRRELIFNWVDALGKWSLLDSYVMVAMMVAFNFRIYLGPTQTENGEPLKITIYTKPEYGFYAFLLGTMCSMALGHAATFFHRYDASPVNRLPGGGPTESLALHYYQPKIALKAQEMLKKKKKLLRDEKNKKNKSSNNRNDVHSRSGGGSMVKTNSGSNFNPIYEDLINEDDDIDDCLINNDKLNVKTNGKKDIKDEVLPYYEREQPSFFVKYGITLVIIATFAVLFVGAFVHSFKFTFGGLTGLILGTVAGPGSTPRSKSYSLISTYETLPDSYPYNNDLGIWFIQQTYLLYGFWVPALHLCLLLVIWLYPLTLRTQAMFLALGEIANAWSAVDVFIFSIFAALLQISKFAAFIVEEPCGSPIAALGNKSINDIIKEIFKARDIDEKYTCLDVEASLTSGAIPLLIAGVSVFSTSYLVLSYAKVAVHDRLDRLVPTGLKMKQDELLKAAKRSVESPPALITSPVGGSGGHQTTSAGHIQA